MKNLIVVALVALGCLFIGETSIGLAMPAFLVNICSAAILPLTVLLYITGLISLEEGK